MEAIDTKAEENFNKTNINNSFVFNKSSIGKKEKLNTTSKTKRTTESVKKTEYIVVKYLTPTNLDEIYTSFEKLLLSKNLGDLEVFENKINSYYNSYMYLKNEAVID